MQIQGPIGLDGQRWREPEDRPDRPVLLVVDHPRQPGRHARSPVVLEGHRLAAERCSTRDVRIIRRDVAVSLAEPSGPIFEGRQPSALVLHPAAALSEAVASAGAVDLAEGAEMLAASEDIAVQSALVSSMSQEDLEIGMHLASVAGQLEAVSNVTEIMGLPRISFFLEDKAQELQDVATQTMLRSGATRALAAAISATGKDIADLGTEEMAEGLTRLAVSDDFAVRSEELAESGAADFVAGVSEVAASEALNDISRDVAAEGTAEVAAGAVELAGSDMLRAASEVIGEEDE